jgi:ribosome biogenesis GTPase
VGAVSAIGKGRHISSSAVMLRLSITPPPHPGPPRRPRSRGKALAGSHSDALHGTHPGWIVDTPGIRSFGLAHVSPESLLHGFPDLVEGTTQCPPNCEHTAAEVDCALDAWVAAGHADRRRLASYRRLLASRSGEEAA